MSNDESVKWTKLRLKLASKIREKKAIVNPSPLIQFEVSEYDNVLFIMGKYESANSVLDKIIRDNGGKYRYLMNEIICALSMLSGLNNPDEPNLKARATAYNDVLNFISEINGDK